MRRVNRGGRLIAFLLGAFIGLVLLAGGWESMILLVFLLPVFGLPVYAIYRRFQQTCDRDDEERREPKPWSKEDEIRRKRWGG